MQSDTSMVPEGMSFTDRDAADRSPLPTSISVAMVAPVALFGTFMMADYPGPNSFTEYFGWWVLCLVAIAGTANLLRRFREGGRLGAVFLLLGIGMPLGFAALLYADIHPDTPLSFKAAVEYSLQIIGVLSLVVLPAFIGWRRLDLRRIPGGDEAYRGMSGRRISTSSAHPD